MGFKEISIPFNEKIEKQKLKVLPNSSELPRIHFVASCECFVCALIFFKIYVNDHVPLGGGGIIFTLYTTAFQGWSELCHL